MTNDHLVMHGRANSGYPSRGRCCYALSPSTFQNVKRHRLDMMWQSPAAVPQNSGAWIPSHQLRLRTLARAAAAVAAAAQLQSIKSELLSEAQALDLPTSPLDALIDQLGGTSAVAEMTGRKGRIVRAAVRAGGAGAGRLWRRCR